jgi:hypothetical protein
VDTEHGRYGEYKVLVDGGVVVDGGARLSPVYRLAATLALGVLLVTAASLGGCSPGRSSACAHLGYREGGLTRDQYLPCVAEMLSTMDALDAQMDAVLNGDKAARAKALIVYHRLGSQIRRAGGRKLLERWQDESLNDLNVKLWNAYTGYQGAIAMPNQPDADAARRNKDEARSLYESLR